VKLTVEQQVPICKRGGAVRESIDMSMPKFASRAFANREADKRLGELVDRANRQPRESESQIAFVKPNRREDSMLMRAATARREDALRSRKPAADRELSAVFRNRPGLWVTFHLVMRSKPVLDTRAQNAKQRDRAMRSPRLADVLSKLTKPAKDRHMLAIAKHCLFAVDNVQEQDCVSGLIDLVAAEYRIELPQVPPLAHFRAQLIAERSPRNG
jgi:hypothetical protein